MVAFPGHPALGFRPLGGHRLPQKAAQPGILLAGAWGGQCPSTCPLLLRCWAGRAGATAQPLRALSASLRGTSSGGRAEGLHCGEGAWLSPPGLRPAWPKWPPGPMARPFSSLPERTSFPRFPGEGLGPPLLEGWELCFIPPSPGPLPGRKVPSLTWNPQPEAPSGTLDSWKPPQLPPLPFAFFSRPIMALGQNSLWGSGVAMEGPPALALPRTAEPSPSQLPTCAAPIPASPRQVPAPWQAW